LVANKKCCSSFVCQRQENQAIHRQQAKNTSLSCGLDSVRKVTKYQDSGAFGAARLPEMRRSVPDRGWRSKIGGLNYRLACTAVLSLSQLLVLSLSQLLVLSLSQLLVLSLSQLLVLSLSQLLVLSLSLRGGGAQDVPGFPV
jgi:hypothetical protein